MDSKILDKDIGGMSCEEFNTRATELSDWLKGFARFGRSIVTDEEDFTLCFALVTMSVINLVDAVCAFHEKMDGIMESKKKEKQDEVDKLLKGFGIKLAKDGTKSS